MPGCKASRTWTLYCTTMAVTTTRSQIAFYVPATPALSVAVVEAAFAWAMTLTLASMAF